MAAPSISPTASRETRASSAQASKIEILTPGLPRQGPHGARARGARGTIRRTCSTTTSRPCRELYRERAPGRRLRLVAEAAADRSRPSTRACRPRAGIMLGLGEDHGPGPGGTLRDLRAHDVDMVTIGQYLQPSAASSSGAAVLDSGGVQGSRGLQGHRPWVSRMWPLARWSVQLLPRRQEWRLKPASRKRGRVRRASRETQAFRTTRHRRRSSMHRRPPAVGPIACVRPTVTLGGACAS